jgi:hypothetical protein
VLTFPQILAGVFTLAGLLLAAILLVVLLPRREEREASPVPDDRNPLPPLNGGNGDGFTR